MQGEGAGKGDSPRPVNGEVYRRNFDSIHWFERKPENQEQQPKETECPKQPQDK